MTAFALEVARVLYLLAPLLVAAALSGVVIRFDLAHALYRPIDAGRSSRGRRVLGDGKTWRGVATAVVGCVIAVAVQKYALWPLARPIALLDYSRASPLALGLALGVGATAGELPNSFVKRRVGIPAGGTKRGPSRVVFYLWDQLDLLTLTWPLLLFWVTPRARDLGISVGLALVVHPLVALIGYLVGARKTAR